MHWLVIRVSAIQVRKVLMKNQRKEIITDNKSFIFMDYQKLAHEYLPLDKITPLKYKMTLIFHDFLKFKVWKYELQKDLDSSCMAIGKRVCLNLAFLVAIQKFGTAKLSLPEGNILDYLDAELRRGVSESLFYK